MAPTFSGVMRLSALALLAASVVHIAHASCKSQYPSVVTTEFDSSVVLPSVTTTAGTLDKITYFYYNSKANVPFTVSIRDYSGVPALFASRASFALTPVLENNEGYSGTSVTFQPTKSECYAIGVQNLAPGSLRLQIISSDDEASGKAPVVLPQTNSCSQLYRGNTVRSRFLFEYSGSFTLSPLEFPNNQLASMTYVYYNAKANQGISIVGQVIGGDSGWPSFYLSRAAFAQVPDPDRPIATVEYVKEANHFRDKNAVYIYPTTDECWVIGIGAQGTRIALTVTVDAPDAATTAAPTVAPTSSPTKAPTKAPTASGTTKPPTAPVTTKAPTRTPLPTPTRTPLPTARTCKSLYPSAVASEFSSSVILPSRTVYASTVEQHSYYYYNSKANVPFTVSFKDFSGHPVFFVSRASFALTPVLENNEGSSEYSLTINPTRSECYAIGVRNLEAGSLRLQIISSDDEASGKAPVVSPQTNSCSQLYRGNTVRSRFLFEYSGSFTLSPLEFPNNQPASMTYVYYNAKAYQGVSIVGQVIGGDKGWPSFYLSRAAFAQVPDPARPIATVEVVKEANYFYDRNSVYIYPTADECWVIGIGAQGTRIALTVTVDPQTANPASGSVSPLSGPTDVATGTPSRVSTHVVILAGSLASTLVVVGIFAAVVLRRQRLAKSQVNAPLAHSEYELATIKA